jgi:flagellar assembly factor FliW
MQDMQVTELPEAPATKTKTKAIINLPLGLLGFEQIKQYNLLARPEDEPFMWLQRLDDCKQGFLVISPSECAFSYQPDLHPDDVTFLKLHAPDDALVLNIVTLRGANQATVNLKGPIVVNRRTLIGKQVVPVNAASYSVQHPLPVAP